MIRPSDPLNFDLNNLNRLAPLEPPANEAEPDWLAALRDESVAAYRRLGLPTLRDEEWRFTNLAPLLALPLHLPGKEHSVTADDLAPFLFDMDCRLLVFVDGVFAPELSTSRPLHNGIKAGSLERALQTHPQLVQPHLGRAAHVKDDAFAAINTAFMHDGVFVHLPQGTVLEEPIHALYVDTQRDHSVVVHPRNLIVAEDNAEVTVIEDYVSLASGARFTNAVTEIKVGENATVHHYMIERENIESFNVSTLKVRQQQDSTFNSHSVLTGGKLVRNNVHPLLEGRGCESLLNGLYIGTGSQHMDNHMRVEHAMPHCDSRQVYKGILADKSHAVFTGRIVVHQDAQKTDAKQTNMNLLLSDHARVDTKPQLEIYADDVKCTHGATIGQVDQDAVFYLRSRGISESDARKMLIYAFANDSLSTMELEPVRRHIEKLLLTRLPQHALLEENA